MSGRRPAGGQSSGLLATLKDAFPSVLGFDPYPNQSAAIDAPANTCLFIVAGPGSGKTTALALRVLRLVLVDDISPESVVATTFTRKAAQELRSRILAWGDQLRRALLTGRLAAAQRERLQKLDFNAIVTGTLDSIAEHVLGRLRAPGTPPPALIEAFVSRALMLRHGLFTNGRFRNTDLSDYIGTLRGDTFGLNTAELSAVVGTIHERFIHDAVTVTAYESRRGPCPVCHRHPHPGIRHVCDAIADYLSNLDTDNVLDYALLEETFLHRLSTGDLDDFAGQVKAVLVDEYQDTNLVQEQIYFELGARAIAWGGGISVVGDDDQSLFRFRGATVELFQGYPDRLQDRLSRGSETIFLTENSRSTRSIVDWCNQYITLDSAYQTVRVAAKPQIRFERNVEHDLPILGLFRPNVNLLARDLAATLHDVFSGPGLRLSTGQVIRKGPGGSIGDCSLLLHSPAEMRGDRQRLPLLLRQELANLTPPVSTFNPRGQHLALVPHVQQLCGLMLECIDPGAQIQAVMGRAPRQGIQVFDAWRVAGRALVRGNPDPRLPRSLQQYLEGWRVRQTSSSGRWPNEVGLADLAYKLVTWIPPLQDDIEALVHLEVVVRTITEAARFSSWGGYIVFRSPRTEQSSVRAALWDIFVPIALGAVEVDEDLLETLPRDRLNILSIHQSKGLEFPLVVVDVGSDYRTNHPRQRRARFPPTGDLTHQLEDELRQFSPLPSASRSGADRAFDDLTRLYFVAFSRARDVLILTGLDSVRNGIENVATGWDRSGVWHWGPGLQNLVHI
jgi:DNA helicase-2/ATP-dependent DNA helicase PcrA